MITGFQKYLVDNGFKRTVVKSFYPEIIEEENYSSMFLSSLGTLEYNFRKDGYYCFFGLVERNKPPVMFLGKNKISVLYNDDDFRTKEDGYRILFSKFGEDMFDEIYDVFISENKYFEVNCKDEKNITISIKTKK